MIKINNIISKKEIYFLKKYIDIPNDFNSFDDLEDYCDDNLMPILSDLIQDKNENSDYFDSIYTKLVTYE